MKTTTRIFIYLLFIGSISCSEDFLETEDKTSLSENNYPQTLDDIEDLLNGVYGTQHINGLFGQNLFPKIIYCLDHTLDLSWQGTAGWIDMSRNNTPYSYDEMDLTWDKAWLGVQRSNTLLEGIQNYRDRFASEADASQLNQLEGQGYFLRAWFYFYLATLWNEDFIVNGSGGDALGVQLIEKTAENLDEAYSTRGTVRETWDFIIADLQAAASLLQGTVWSGAERYKASEWAAKGMLGKAYVYTESWESARTTLADVVNNSGKQLVSFDVYKQMFNGDFEYNSESLFEVQLKDATSGWGTDEYNTGSAMGMVMSPTYGIDRNASGWSNVFPHDKNIERFGFSLDIPASASDPAYIAQSATLRDTKAVDPRLYVSTLQPFLDSMIVSGNKEPISYYSGIPLGDFYGWSFKKYVNLKGSEYEVAVSNGNNIYTLRLADVYLLYAEALIETGDNAQGLEYINKVKRRAYNLPVNSTSAIDYASLTAQTSASDPVLQNDPLKYERWAELFGEGQWWADVRRWKIGQQEAAYYQRVRGGTIDWQDTDYAQPIPSAELIANPNMVQNEGYPSR